jgi:hypothetical protein
MICDPNAPGLTPARPPSGPWFASPRVTFGRGLAGALVGVLVGAAGCQKGSSSGAAPGASSAAAAASSAPEVVVDLSKVRCPEAMAPIALVGGCIDRWEASAGPGAVGEPDGAGTTVVARSVAGQMPLTGVTLKQAAVACKNAGKRLCKDAEWRSSCRGQPREGERDYYSYGVEYEPRRCRDWDASDNSRKGAARTGEYPRCQNAQGVFDLTGNVGELTDGAIKLDLQVIRGGTYVMTAHDSACDTSGYRVSPSKTGPDIGFRCCADALP